jgi:hypothetical protein
MTDEQNQEMGTPEISDRETRKLPLWERYKRGWVLFEVGGIAAVPFIFLWLSSLLLPIPMIVLAALSFFAVPILMYDQYARSTRRKLRSWLEDSP